MDESPDFNLDSFNPNELSLIENIRKLATENAAIKQSLAQHNRLIEVGILVASFKMVASISSVSFRQSYSFQCRVI